jgi:hypothetical protein
MGVDRVLTELQGIRETTIAVIDDNFFHDLDRAARLAKEIARSSLRKKRFFLFGSAELVVRRPDVVRLWKEAGLAYFYMGVEGAGSLEQYNKPVTPRENERAIQILRDLDLDLIVSFIIRPDFDEEDFLEILGYIDRHGIDYPLFPILTPFPGSTLFDEAQGQILTHNYALYDFLHAVTQTRLPRDRFYRAYAGLYEHLGQPERKRRVRRRTLGRAFRHYRPWEWPGLLWDAPGFLGKWRALGRRLADPDAYLRDDLAEAPCRGKPEAGDPVEAEVAGRDGRGLS